MGNLVITKRFASPPDRVFACMSDLEHADERVRGIDKIEMLTDGPVGAGTRFRETRTMFGKQATEEMEITAFEPGKSFTISAHSCGTDMSFEHRFIPEGGGTRMEMEMFSRPQTLKGKLMAPLGFLMKGTMRKCIEKDLADLERHIDGVGDAAPATA